MITVNSDIINVKHFPDGTQSIEFPTSDNIIYNNDLFNRVCWFYDSDEEVFTLMCVVDWIRRNWKNARIKLFMPYLPNARMDRIKKSYQNFSLKVFSKFINSLGFEAVDVYNVHSNVSEALIDNIYNIEPYFQVQDTMSDYKPDVIYFPDEGACKRYADLGCIKDSELPVIFGIKKRVFSTGEITGLDVISDIDLTGKKVLIVDDICSAGGTFKFSAMKLKELGASDVALYVTHCEDNIKNGVLLTTDLISKIYTTDSILHIEDPKIKIIQYFRK